MDLFLFQKINSLAHISKILDWIGIFLAEYLLWIAGLVLITLFLIKKTRLMAGLAGLSIILSRLVITELIRYFYHSPRPYLALETAKKLIVENRDYASFPSGHAAIFFAIAIAVYFFSKKWGTVAFIIAILVGLSRIYVGVHWPVDILGGAAIGIISGIIINKLFFKYYGHKIKNQRNSRLAGKRSEF